MNDDIVAISYAHDDASFNEKVMSLVSFLQKQGYNVAIDECIKQKETAIDFNEMMSKLLQTAKKVIVLLTPKYKERADKFKGGVGFEYRIILDEITNNPKKYIFASFEPVNEQTIGRIKPLAIGNREIVHLSDDGQCKNLFSKLSDIPLHSSSNVDVNKADQRKNVLNLRQHKNRSDLFNQAMILLCENKQILEQFGPDSNFAINNPLSSVVNTWDWAKNNKILPNNRKIVEDFQHNISVLSKEEVEIFIKFKIHVDAFESCTKGEISREGIPMFPFEFEQMIKGGV